MTNIWHDINPKRITPEDYMCVIEISKGSKNNTRSRVETGLLKLDRILYTSTHYPGQLRFHPAHLRRRSGPARRPAPLFGAGGAEDARPPPIRSA